MNTIESKDLFKINEEVIIMSFKDFQACCRAYNYGLNEHSNNSEHISAAFNELCTEAYNVGYDLTATVDGDVKLEAIENACNMPKITVEKHETEPNCFFYHTIVEFPVMCSIEHSFDNVTEHWMNEWARIGRLITMINSFEYISGKCK